MLNIYTFEYFWKKYHDVYKLNKLDKVLCRIMWQRTLSSDLKQKVIQSIHKDNKSHNNAYEYLKNNLKL